MADGTGIEWTDATWNPITGCSVVSPGCTNCYAMKLAGTRLRNHSSRAGLTRDTRAGPVWNGTVRFNEEWLDQPLRWRRPRMIFVCAHADLFHENVPDEWIDRVFAVMALAPQHTFQVLTKRSARMRAYLSAARAHPVGLAAMEQTLKSMAANAKSDVGAGVILKGDFAHLAKWPLPNVWLGVSAEDQRRADERIPDLLATPAAVRWCSAEPLLGGIDFRNIPRPGMDYGHRVIDALSGIEGVRGKDGTWIGADYGAMSAPRLDWIVAGGESGDGARPMHPDWVRKIRDDCKETGVAFNFKQHGEYVEIDGVRCTGHHGSRQDFKDGYWLTKLGRRINMDDPLAQFCSVWGTDSIIRKVGKKAAGRLLDGVLHDEFPKAAR